MSLIAWYPLNGNTNDYSGNNYPTGSVNGATINSSGKIGQSYYFNGIDNTISFGTGNTFFPLVKHSITLWFKSDGLTDTTGTSPAMFGFTYGIIGRVDNNGIASYRLYTTDGAVSVDSSSDGYNYHDSKWHHFTAICDGSIIKLYIDGIYKSQAVVASFWKGYTSWPTNTWNLGRDNNNSMYYFKGSMNDLRIYDHALSEKEIKEIAKAKILHYTFDDFQEPTTNLLYGKLINTTHERTNLGRVIKGWQATGVANDNPRIHIQSTSLSVSPSSYYCFSAIYYNSGAVVDDVYLKFNDTTGWPEAGTYFQPFTDQAATMGGAYQQINLGGNWYYCYGTFQTLSTTNSITHIFFDSDIVGNIVFIGEIQLEKKPYATSYTESVRNGIINDQSGFRNNATLAEATTPRWVSDSKIGSGAYSFNGLTTKIDLDNLSTSDNKITMSAWVYTKTLSKTSAIIRKENSFLLQTNTSGQFRPHVYVNGSWYSLTTAIDTIQLNTWQLLSAVYDGTNLIAYINGQEIQRTSLTGSINPSSNVTAFGYYSTTEWHDGYIDDVRIYATALSASDILELYQTRVSVDNSGNLFVGEIKNYYSIYKNQNEIQSYDNNFSIYAKQHPTDGGSEPTAGVYLEGIKAYSYGRDWHISVWDPTTNNWASNVNFYQATSISGAHARYDVYNSSTRVVQQQAFVATLQDLEPKYIVIIGGSHAPGFYNIAMRDEMIKYGGTIQKLSWTSSESYILVGKKDIGAGNAIVEVLSNLNSVDNGGSTWARADFGLNHEINKIFNKGVLLNSNISELGITDGLVAYYPFDKDARDYSGNSYHGTVYASMLSNGIKGSSYSFDGTANTYIQLGLPSGLFTSLTSCSISFWIKENVVTHWLPFTGQTTSHYIMATSGGTGAFYHGTTTGTLTIYKDSIVGTTPISDTNWHHYVITGVNLSAWTSMKLSGYGDPWWLEGLVDEVRIYNRALTQKEVSIIYETTAPNTAAMKITQDTVYLKGEFKEVI